MSNKIDLVKIEEKVKELRESVDYFLTNDFDGDSRNLWSINGIITELEELVKNE